MITYYRDDSVLVTSQAIKVDGRSYALGDVASIWHRAGGRDAAGRRTLLSRTTHFLVPVVPALAGLGVLVFAVQAGGDPAQRIALLVVAGLLFLLTVPLLDVSLGRVDRTYDRGTRVHEIWANWQGRQVLLVRTNNRTRFGQIYRAMERALD